MVETGMAFHNLLPEKTYETDLRCPMTTPCSTRATRPKAPSPVPLVRCSMFAAVSGGRWGTEPASRVDVRTAPAAFQTSPAFARSADRARRIAAG